MPWPWTALDRASASACFYLKDLVCFAAGLSGDLRALGGVDVVHRFFDFDVGDDVGDESVEDVEAEAGHGGVELGFDGDGDAGLLRKSDEA
jgi:hypothetical protein